MQGHAMYNVYIYNVLYKIELKLYKQSFGGNLQRNNVISFLLYDPKLGRTHP